MSSIEIEESGSRMLHSLIIYEITSSMDAGSDLAISNPPSIWHIHFASLVTPRQFHAVVAIYGRQDFSEQIWKIISCFLFQSFNIGDTIAVRNLKRNVEWNGLYGTITNLFVKDYQHEVKIWGVDKPQILYYENLLNLAEDHLKVTISFLVILKICPS